MGDCDCTYDFRELGPFVEKFRGGAEFIMGSRFRGYIEPGSMPPLHRYLGTPVTTLILNVDLLQPLLATSTAACAASRATALERMDLRSQSWEYASEMVLKSVHMELRTEEVPIRFLKDREGRLSHHKRSGWFSPWHAAWINLRAMFVYGADFFLFKPGLLLLVAGPAADAAALVRPGHARTDHLLAALDAAGRFARRSSGLQCVFMGILSQVFFDYSGAGHGALVRALPLYAHGRDRARRSSRLGVRAATALLAGSYAAPPLPLARGLAHQQPGRSRASC